MMKTPIKIGLAVVVMGILTNLLFGGGADKDADIPALIRDGALVIDVRTAGEFSGGHIEGAINIPHNVISREIEKHETGKAKAIIVYCRSGARSTVAKKALEHAGYTNVVNGGSLHHMRKLSEQ
jgi:phage shock protein E